MSTVGALLISAFALASLAILPRGGWRRPLAAAALAATLAGIVAGADAASLSWLTRPWVLVAIAALGVLADGLRGTSTHDARASIAVGASLLLPAATLHAWALPDAAAPTPVDLALSTTLLLALACTAWAFGRSLRGLLLAGHGRAWLACSLVVLALLCIAPWAGQTTTVPLALTSGPFWGGGTLVGSEMVTAAADRGLVEIALVATADSALLSVIREIALLAALAALVLLAIARTVRADTVRGLFVTAAVVAAVSALALPVLSLLGPAEAEAPQARPLLLGMPVAASLLAGVSFALFGGLARARSTATRPVEISANPGRLAYVLLAAALLAGLALSAATAGGVTLSSPPWPLLLGALIAVWSTRLGARLGLAPDRMAAVGTGLAFLLVLVAVVGPGEGWLTL